MRPGHVPRHCLFQPAVLPAPTLLSLLSSVSLVQNLYRQERNVRLKDIDVSRILRIQQIEDVIEKYYLVGESKMAA